MNLRRSKQFILITLSSVPFGLDDVMMSISDKKHHVKFIYGNGVFVVFFNSRKSYSTIKEIALIKMTGMVEGLFIFRNNRKSLGYLSTHLATKMGKMRSNKVGISDITNLTNVLNMLSNDGYVNYVSEDAPFDENFFPEAEEVVDEYEMTDNERMDALLMKMRKLGYGSLTPAELDFLKEYKDNNTKKEDDELDK